MDNLIGLKNGELREKIIAVAGKLFKQQGFENTSMDQIAAEALVSRETLYAYFASKEAIGDAWIRDIFQGIARATWESLPKLSDSRSRLTAAISNIYEWSELNAELARAVMIYRLKFFGTCKIFENTGTLSLIAEIIHRGRDTGELKDDIPLKMILAYIDHLASAILLDWLNNNGQGDLQGEIAPLVNLILCGIPGKPDT